MTKSIPIQFPPKPALTRAIDWVDRLIFPLTGGIVPVSLMMSWILNQAEALSTQTDSWPEVLGGETAHRCYVTELRYFLSVVRWGDLTATGRIVMLANYAHGPMIARRKLREALRADPDVVNVQLKPIVIICGPARSGTSLMQNLFAACPGSLTVRTMTALTWNINNDAPLYPRNEADLASTIQKYHSTILAQMEFLVGREGLRAVDASHAMVYDPMEAQEDGMFLSANGIFQGGEIPTGGTYEIQKGSPNGDPDRFRYHFLFLRVFYQLWQKNWRGTPVERWIVKAPYYTRDVATFLDVLSQPAKPENSPVSVTALVGQRDKRDMIPSEVRLMCTLTSLFGVASGLGLDSVNLLARGVLRRAGGGIWTPQIPGEDNVRVRDLLSSHSISYDYSRLVQDPEEYVRHLVETNPQVFGMTSAAMNWSAEWAEGIRQYLKKNKETRRQQALEGLLVTKSLEECGVSHEDLVAEGIL
ncbi:hypothetical protein HDU93_004178 [Gonapodya sp. JEL0774]|nr:hypothetical protein HDU93_004178 [Gonapodya sp. JEL0774]